MAMHYDQGLAMNCVSEVFVIGNPTFDDLHFCNPAKLFARHI